MVIFGLLHSALDTTDPGSAKCLLILRQLGLGLHENIRGAFRRIYFLFIFLLCGSVVVGFGMITDKDV